MVHNGQYVYPMAYVTERQSALPDAKPEPEMGQLNSPWPTYGGSANYTMGLSGTVWPLHMGARLYRLGRALRYKRSKRSKKTSEKSNFLVGGLAHGREIFRVDAAFVAAHFPPRVVWGPNPTNGDISPKRRRNHAHFEK